MVMDAIQEYQSDHDLLVRLDERMAGMSKSLEELSGANTTKNDDHEKRLQAAEAGISNMHASHMVWRFVFTSALSLIGLGLTLLAFVVR